MQLNSLLKSIYLDIIIQQTPDAQQDRSSSCLVYIGAAKENHEIIEWFRLE